LAPAVQPSKAFQAKVKAKSSSREMMGKKAISLSAQHNISF
jgi:hypothetical protein